MPKLTKRADGRYQVNAVIGYDENGKRIQKVFYGKTQREALEKKAAYLEGLAVNADAKSMTVRRWAGIWVERYSRGGYRNQENNKSIIRVFLDYLKERSNRPINDLIPADIQGFAKSMSTCSKSHVSKVKYVINQLFKTAIDNGYVAKSPCEGVIWDSVKDGSREALDEKTVKIITENWNTHSAGVWAMFVLYAGLRPSEAFALKAENITEDGIKVTDGSHFEHGRLVIMPGQTKSDAGQRTIPILPPLRPVLKTLPSEGLVCTSTKGQPVSQSAYKRNWAAFCNKIGIKTDLYSLRHTFCSTLYDAGVDVKTAQYLMGHADLEVTMKIYTHLSEKKKTRSYDALFKHFESV